MDKSLVFTPGCKYTFVKEGCHNVSGHVIMFVEYETVSGEHKRQRFDLVDPSVHFVIDGHRQAQLSYITDPPEGVKLDIKRVLYREESCLTIIGGKMFVPTRIEFDTVIHVQKESPDVDSDRIKTIDQRIAYDTRNSAYGIASRDWADVLADSERYIHMQQSRCNGKTLWLSSATSFADKQPLWNITKYHDICEQWLKEPPKPLEFISDDLEDCEKGVPNTKLIDPTALYLQDTATGEMKPYEGIKNITPKPMHFRGTTWTHPESAYGKKGHMLITDISSKSLIRDDDYLDVEVGDVMLYDNSGSAKAEPEDHGKLFVWLGLGVGWKKLSDNGYFDTDMAMTKEEMQYCRNDVAVTEKLFKEEQVMNFNSCKPTIKKVVFSEPATIVFWSDGTKTIVKCGENDIFDPEKGVAMACMKKLLGTNKTGSNYLDKVQEYFDAYDGEQLEKRLAVRQRFMKFLAGCVKNGTDSKDIPPEVTVEKEFEAVTSSDWTVVSADENTTAEENGE